MCNSLLHRNNKLLKYGQVFRQSSWKLAQNGKDYSLTLKFQNFSKIFGGRCETWAPIWRHFPKFFEAVSKQQYRNETTIESSKLGTMYNCWGEKFDLASFFPKFGNLAILVTSWSQNWVKKGHICILYSNCKKIKLNNYGFLGVSNSFLRWGF